MLNDIYSKIVLTAVGFITTGALGYIIGVIKNYKKSDKTQQEALKCLLRSSITSKYFVYNEMKEIPAYEKENVNYMFEAYKNLGGNSYVKGIVGEINQLKIKK